MFLVDWAVKMRIRPPEFETSICDAKYHVSLSAAPPPLQKPSSPPPPYAAARFRRKIVSGQFDEENPFVLISSVLLVQADEGVSFLVVDRIGNIYRNLPRRADVIITTVGARHKCQQESRRKRNRNSDWNRGRTRRRPTARMNARGTCTLAAHGWAPLLAIVAGRCAKRAGWPFLRATMVDAGSAGRRWRSARCATKRCTPLDARCRAPACALEAHVIFVDGGAAGRPPLRRISGDVVTAGLNSSRVWFGPVPGSP
ncbi:hypothetical protein F511_27265 [Dorcoceras hygrometricum]|uniref:Uncharacterized protein n=1 Tax=Dorcoceras hygrometricum TaxID=472368 RepID=A0A2Z7CJI9_9LAMI|nr:hypothetical protein F511_27265 [Dorcoceras hygrometricum]